VNRRKVLSIWSVPRLYNESLLVARVEAAGSNTSTVALRVVGGDEKGSLESETVKYGPSPMGLVPENDCAVEGQQQLQKTDPSSRQRERPTSTNP
jgi:hypothetical protein